MSAQPSQGKIERAATACRNCRQRKVRCSGGNPCKDCTRLRRECVYPIPQRRRRKLHGIRNLDSQREASEKTTEQSGEGSTTEARKSDGIPRSQQQSPETTSKRPTSLVTAPQVDGVQIALEPYDPNFSIQTHAPSTTPVSRVDDDMLMRPVTPRIGSVYDFGESNGGHDIEIFGSSTYQEELDQNLGEFNRGPHEPWSWTSICSDIGSKWICSVTGCRSFVSIAKKFATDFNCRPPPETNLLTDQSSFEVEEEAAWRYVEAFYRNCWEADMGIVYRADLETLLHGHFRNHILKNDHAWFALRNVIFAIGYRSLLAKDASVSFAAAHTKAGSLFKNALSMLTKLLLGQKSLMALQALTLMALYVEGLGNATSYQILCSNAVYLAQARGLHYQPEQSELTLRDDSLKNNWLWWPLYTLEKHLSFRSGRPSMIDDNSMSSQIPATVPYGSNLHLQNMSIAIRHAKIQSQISRQLLTSKATELPTNELIDLVVHFHRELKQLLEDIPPEFRIGTLARPSYSAPRLIHILYLHFSIYGSIMSLHAHFFYPWMTARFAAEGYNAALEAQLASSPGTIAEAARQIILAIRLVNTDVTTPSWLTFYYPIYATINLFIYLLKYPTLSSASADLGLLDVCAGHFGYMEFLTSSQVSISLPREAANLASKVVKAAKRQCSTSTSWRNSSLSQYSRRKSQISLDMDHLDFDGHNHEPEPMTEPYPLHDPLGWSSSAREVLEY